LRFLTSCVEESVVTSVTRQRMPALICSDTVGSNTMDDPLVASSPTLVGLESLSNRCLKGVVTGPRVGGRPSLTTTIADPAPAPLAPGGQQSPTSTEGIRTAARKQPPIAHPNEMGKKLGILP
jgi:hypothetical protein